ncbi:MAG: hypothetical protein WCK78_08165 [Paludibacter sp.]
MYKLLIICLFTLISFISCVPTSKILKLENEQLLNSVVRAEAQVIVYKTIKDYSQFVPVTMNEERTRIVSYPAPSDLFVNGKPTLPTSLKNGYLLDNRGINKNVVFLNYTYETYGKMNEAPSLEEMLKNIKDKFPLVELIYCGPQNKFKDEIKELNILIDKGFPGCQKAKIIPMTVNSITDSEYQSKN